MEVNEQTLYDDELLNILPDGVIILDINGKIIQLNQQALTELHVHSSVNTMMPLPTSQIFKLLNNKEDILSTILEKISQGERIYTLPEHTYIQEQVDHTQFPIRGEFATIRNKGNLKTILFFFHLDIEVLHFLLYRIIRIIVIHQIEWCRLFSVIQFFLLQCLLDGIFIKNKILSLQIYRFPFFCGKPSPHRTP